VTDIGDCFHVPTKIDDYVSSGDCKKNTDVLIDKAIDDFEWSHYVPKIVFKKEGSLRNKSGYCLTFQGTKEPIFKKCLKSNDAQSFKFHKGASKTVYIEHTDENSKDEFTYLFNNTSEDNENEFTKYTFNATNKTLFKVDKKSKSYRFRLQLKDSPIAGNDKYCIASPFGKKIGHAKCDPDFYHEYLKFYRRGYSPEDRGKDNYDYKKSEASRKAPKLQGWNLVKAIGAQCVKHSYGNSKVVISKCNEKKEAFFFQINRSKKYKKYFTIKTRESQVVEKKNTIYLDDKGKKRLYTFTKKGESYEIKEKTSGKCLQRVIDDESDERELVFRTCNENFDQAFVLIGFSASDPKAKGTAKTTAKATGKGK